MKKPFVFWAIAALSFLFVSCQDKYNPGINLNAHGSLKYEGTGNCLPKTINGTYTAGTDLTVANSMQVTVNVTTTGNYTIKTNEVNGYSFSASGNFSNTGTNQVTLQAKGKPVAAGTNDFIVTFDTSSCHVDVTAVAAAGTNTPTGSFTLTGSPNSCMNATVSGAFVKDAALDTSDKVSVAVNVTTPGTYTLSTNVVNGYSFSATGTFTTTGAQNIVLLAAGKPAAAGTDNFSVTGGSSTCTFPVTVLLPIAVANNDLFPLRYGSYVTYGDDPTSAPVDTMKRIVNDSVIANSAQYMIVQEIPKFGQPVNSSYRKSGDDYFEFASVDKYTTSVTFSPQIKKDLPFLKENLATGDKWNSDEYIGPSSFGQTIYIRYEYKCLAANAAATIGGKTFGNVCKMLISPQIRSAPTYPYNSTGEFWEQWYAKGVGLIYQRKSNNFSVFYWYLRFWEVK